MNTSFLLLTACSLINGVASNGNVVLTAGTAETVVTPAMDGPQVYDDLYARALVLSDGTTRLAIVTIDSGGISDWCHVDMLLRGINRATGISEGNVAINCSHTHNAPWPDDQQWKKNQQISTVHERKILYDEWLGDSVKELNLDSYAKWFYCHIVEVVKRANNELQPATLRAGRQPVMIAYNRRLMKNGRIVMAPNPKGAVVPWVDVLGVYDEDSERITVLFSHAAHPVIVHFQDWPNKTDTHIGPDYPGYAVKHLRNLLTVGDEPAGLLMFAQGCAGNINGNPLRGGLGAADIAGLSLGAAANRALTDAVDVAPALLRAQSLKLSLPLRVPPETECKEWLRQNPQDEAISALLDVDEAGQPEYLPFPMRAFAVGDELCILTLPLDTFAEYQLFADEVSPFKNTFVFGYTNGTGVYVGTKEAYDLGLAGGYEASPLAHVDGAVYYLQPSVEQCIHEGIRQLFCKLKSD